MDMRTLQTYRQEIDALSRRHGVSQLRVFGSTVKGQTGLDSDLDLLVSLEPGRSLLDRAAFKADLQDLLGIKVDAVNPATLHPLIREQVQQEAQPL